MFLISAYVIVFIVIILFTFWLVVYQSNRYQNLLYFLFHFTFFLNILPSIRSDEFNYFAYYAIVVITTTMVYIAKDFKVKFNLVVLYLCYFIVNTLMVWQFEYIIENYSLLILPLLALCIYLLIRHYATENSIRFFLNIFLITAVIQSILGISQSLLGFPYFGKDEIFYQSERNYLAIIIPWISPTIKHGMGTFEHFNGLGSLLTLAIPILFANWLQQKGKITSFVSFIIVFTGLIMTYSRGSLVGSLFGCTLYYFLKNKNRRLLWIFALFLFIGLAFYFSEAFLQYFRQTENVSFRLKVWNWSISYILQNPHKLIFGYGFSFFRNEFFIQNGTFTDIHSGLIQIVLELGILGISIFYFMIKSLVKNRIPDNLNYLSLALLCSLLGFLFHQLFDNALFGQLSIIFYSFIGILIKLTDIYQMAQIDTTFGSN